MDFDKISKLLLEKGFKREYLGFAKEYNNCSVSVDEGFLLNEKLEPIRNMSITIVKKHNSDIEDNLDVVKLIEALN